jgi:hypothetical protein
MVRLFLLNILRFPFESSLWYIPVFTLLSRHNIMIKRSSVSLLLQILNRLPNTQGLLSETRFLLIEFEVKRRKRHRYGRNSHVL